MKRGANHFKHPRFSFVNISKGRDSGIGQAGDLGIPEILNLSEDVRRILPHLVLQAPGQLNRPSQRLKPFLMGLNDA